MADPARIYIEYLKPDFPGTVQLQGGITVETTGSAIGAGAEFLVCGTQIFRDKDGLEPEAVIDRMLQEAARVLNPRHPAR